MHQDQSGEDLFLIDDPAAYRPWFRVGELFSWLFPLLGLLAFETFGDPCLSVVIGCLKFGYSDFRTAFWLRRDPYFYRGKTISLCYFSRGMYVVAATAFLFIAAMGLYEHFFRPNFFQVESSFLTGLVMCFSGLFLGTVFASVAFRLAALHQVRIWMDSTIHQSRRENRWTEVCVGTHNQIHWLCVAVLTVTFLTLSGMMFGVAHAKDRQGMLATSVVLSVLTCLCLNNVWGCWRLTAKSPEECWGDVNEDV